VRGDAEVAARGCIVCGGMGYLGTPAEVHHLRAGVGMGQRGTRAIPLCPRHHRTGGYGVALHAGQREWESRYGSEVTLYLSDTASRVGSIGS
jgi:hypothetical protein